MATPMDDIAKAHDLFTKGAITETEFEQIKADLLSRPATGTAESARDVVPTRCPGCGAMTAPGDVECRACATSAKDTSIRSAFYRSGGRESARGFDETDIAYGLKSRYSAWVSTPGDSTWGDFMREFYQQAPSWLWGPGTVPLLRAVFPEAHGQAEFMDALRWIESREAPVSSDPVSMNEQRTKKQPVADARSGEGRSAASPGQHRGLQTRADEAGSEAARRKRAVQGVVGAVIVIALLGFMLVASTQNECERRRVDHARYKTNGWAVRCPLGFEYSSDWTCPIHGALADGDTGIMRTNSNYWGQ